jgi:cytochrome b561
METRMTASANRYSGGAILLHWLIATLLLANVVIAFTMEDVRGLMPLHKSIGITVLLLTLVRIGWRLTHAAPPLSAALAPWERLAARVTHGGFYLLLLVSTPARLGGGVDRARAAPATLFGVIPWFDLPLGKSHELHEPMGEAHELAAYLTIALIVLHVAGAHSSTSSSIATARCAGSCPAAETSSGVLVDPQLAELAVEGRATDAEPPGHFGHPPAIMADREADHVRLDLLQRAQVSVGLEQRHARPPAPRRHATAHRPPERPPASCAICGKSARVSASPSHSTAARNSAFCSWRTLPGQS